MSVGPPLLARRTALTLGAAAIALAGCDGGDSDEPGSVSSSTPPADPDAGLVADILVDLGHAEKLALRAGLTDLADLHRAHIDALEGPPRDEAAPAQVPLKAVRRAEVRLQRILVHASMNAESGALARLFASMSAACAQRLSVGLA